MNRLRSTGLVLSAFLCAGISRAQTAVPYSTGFDNTAQQAGWQVFKKGVSGSSKPYWVFSSFKAFSAPNSLSHSYPVGGTEVTDNWMVSPMFHLPSGGRIDSVRHSFSGFGMPNDGDTVALYLLEGNPDPALATSRTLLKDYRGSSYNNDGEWYQTTGIAIPAAASHCYIAFRYRTIVNWLDVKFDNLAVSGKTTGIGETDKAGISGLFYPNPATGLLHFRPEAGIKEIAIHDISGKELMRHPFAASISIAHLVPGTYFLRSVLHSGLVIPKMFVKI